MTTTKRLHMFETSHVCQFLQASREIKKGIDVQKNAAFIIDLLIQEFEIGESKTLNFMLKQNWISEKQIYEEIWHICSDFQRTPDWMH